ncbi:MAG: hypothetical protein SGPRY_005001, partial [Prymnesium sp.]
SSARCHEARVLLSFAPMLMLRAIENGTLSRPPCSQQYSGVALFADISGFSQLNERFAPYGGEGFGQMMSLVNFYFTQMTKIISACGGDVIKFAGDALIVLWLDAPKSVLMHRACECALELQDALHNAQMNSSLLLSLKIGIGVGSATMFYVGGHQSRCEYFAAGPALRESFEACALAGSGDVMVSAAVHAEVKEMCQAREVGGCWSICTMQRSFHKRSLASRALPERLSEVIARLRSYVPSAMLKAVELEAQLGQSVRSWTASVVEASVLFVHFGIEGLMDLMDLDCERIHLAVVAVQRCVTELGGSIHRFTVDDKGCVMKVVFGANEPLEQQPQRALLAALQLVQALSSQGVQPSVGVASGEALLGPVGGNARQEFTVHGDRIIVAARLMQLAAKLGGMVLCDEGTYSRATEQMRFITLLPVKLKGSNREMTPYRPISSLSLTEKPSLAHKAAAGFVRTAESTRLLHRCARWLRADEPCFEALSLEGEQGSGKSELQMQARAVLEPCCKVLHVRCRPHESSQPGAAVRRLLAQLCSHDVWPSLALLSPLLRDDDKRQALKPELQLLCSLGQREGPHPAQGEGARPRLAMLVDDLQFADAYSCELLGELATSRPAGFLLLTACRVSLVEREERGPLGPGRSLTRALGSGLGALRLLLHRWSAASCEALASHLLCARQKATHPLPRALLAVVEEGGNPLLVHAVVRHVSEGSLISLSEGRVVLAAAASEGALSEVRQRAVWSVRQEAVGARLGGESTLAQLVLKTMALLPSPCSFASLLAAFPLAVGEGMLHEVIEELWKAGWVGRRGERWEFAEEGMREVCEHAMLSPQKRQIQIRCHRRGDSLTLTNEMADTKPTPPASSSPPSSPSLLSPSHASSSCSAPEPSVMSSRFQDSLSRDSALSGSEGSFLSLCVSMGDRDSTSEKTSGEGRRSGVASLSPNSSSKSEDSKTLSSASTSLSRSYPMSSYPGSSYPPSSQLASTYPPSLRSRNSINWRKSVRGAVSRLYVSNQPPSGSYKQRSPLRGQISGYVRKVVARCGSPSRKPLAPWSAAPSSSPSLHHLPDR